MNRQSDQPKKSIWKRLGDAFDALEIGFRLLLGLAGAAGAAMLVLVLGGHEMHLWTLPLMAVAIGVGFIIGFFWEELRLLFGLVRVGVSFILHLLD